MLALPREFLARRSDSVPVCIQNQFVAGHCSGAMWAGVGEGNRPEVCHASVPVRSAPVTHTAPLLRQHLWYLSRRVLWNGVLVRILETIITVKDVQVLLNYIRVNSK